MTYLVYYKQNPCCLSCEHVNMMHMRLINPIGLFCSISVAVQVSERLSVRVFLLRWVIHWRSVVLKHRLSHICISSTTLADLPELPVMRHTVQECFPNVYRVTLRLCSVAKFCLRTKRPGASCIN